MRNVNVCVYASCFKARIERILVLLPLFGCRWMWLCSCWCCCYFAEVFCEFLNLNYFIKCALILKSQLLANNAHGEMCAPSCFMRTLLALRPWYGIFQLIIVADCLILNKILCCFNQDMWTKLYITNIYIELCLTS